MKKLTLLCMAAMAVTASAQIELINFEDGNLTNDKVSAITPPNGTYVRSSGVVANPDATGINKSAKVYNILEGSLSTENVAENKIKHVENRVFMELDSPITIDANSRYMHMMMRRNFVNNNCATVMYFNLDTQTTTGHGAALSRILRFEATPSQSNVWQDIVLDLQGLIDGEAAGVISTIAIVPNINKFSNTYLAYTDLCIDDIVFNADAAPRGAKAVKPTTGTIFDFEDKDIAMENMIGGFMYTCGGNLSTGAASLLWAGTDGEETSICNDGEYAFNVDFCAENPNKTINTTTKAVATIKGLQFQFNGAVVPVSEENKYLHVMVYSPYATSVLRIDPYNFCKPNGKETTIATFTDIAVQNQWTDLVVDLSTIMSAYLETAIPITYLAGVGVSVTSDDQLMEGDPKPLFYFDEVAVNNDPNPRTEVTSALPSVALDGVSVRAIAGKLIVNGADATARVSVFSVSGQQVAETTADRIATMPALNQGIYIVRIADAATKLVVR